ncbi:GTPase family protein [Rhodopila globiformis]|uniref:G domain-containing protein n=1 Tax=Rhodopila globiformis TaxID=1071 RepID=A0A2S6NP61_RHOGL|nr:hypothetical protein [Rhodopila globiformis]PPQ40138.1 hypothetical protein CCS01_00730 [Rhodopila globiformis]
MDLQQAAPLAPADIRAAFYAAMSGLRADFAAAAADIDAREATLNKALGDVRYMMHDGVGKTVFAPSHPLARFMIDFNRELVDILDDWLNRIEQYDRKTTFRKGFTDSLVVFVLGKVKAGKSSLGNYMAYGRSNPEGEPITGAQPDFFTAAMAQGAENQAEAATGQGGYFRVGARETTKSIQGFRIPGLTWVDSPGLHSVTPENGALASDYADVADLIVYPMHSGNPGRAGDITEIQQLLWAKKRFLVVITQCDMPQEDEAPDGTIFQQWVMKDRAARQKQTEYVRHAVSSAGEAVPFDILSLSVRYAETHDNDPAALEDSGVADFLNLLTEIARSEGVCHKRETPSRNLDHFVELILGADARSDTLSVVRVLDRLGDLESKLTAADAELSRRADRVAAAVLGRIGPMVAYKVKCHADDKEQAGFERACTESLRQIVAEETQAEIRSLLAAQGGALVAVPTLAEISALVRFEGLTTFESLTIKISKSNRKATGAIGKAIGGAVGGAAGVAGGMAATSWAGAEAGAALGTVVPGIGNVIGMAAGTVIGAFLGYKAGKALGRDSEVSIQSGDNRAEVQASATKILQDAGQAAVAEFFAAMKSAAITPVKQRAARLDYELRRFADILTRKVHSNGRSVQTRV